MERKKELLKVFDGNDCKPVIIKLVEDMVYLEKQLTEYKKVLKETPITSESKNKYKFYHSLYKEDLQQYTNIVGKLSMAIAKAGGDPDDSPLRSYFKKLQGDKE